MSWYCRVCLLIFQSCGTQNSGVGAEGARSTIVEAAEGRPHNSDSEAANMAIPTHTRSDIHLIKATFLNFWKMSCELLQVWIGLFSRLWLFSTADASRNPQFLWQRRGHAAGPMVLSPCVSNVAHGSPYKQPHQSLRVAYRVADAIIGFYLGATDRRCVIVIVLAIRRIPVSLIGDFLFTREMFVIILSFHDSFGLI